MAQQNANLPGIVNPFFGNFQVPNVPPGQVNAAQAPAPGAGFNQQAPAQAPAALSLFGVNINTPGANNAQYINLGGAMLNENVNLQVVIGDEIPEAIMQEFLAYDISQVTNVLEAFIALITYQGFNALHIQAVLWAHYSRNVPGNWSDEIKGRRFLLEVLQLISAFFTRGTNIIQAITKSTGDARIVLQAMQAKYQITGSGKGSNDAITLARVAQAFPDLVAGYIQSMASIRVISERIDLPKGLQFTGAACMIPNGSFYMVLHLAWARGQDRIVNSKKYAAGEMDNLPENQKYYYFIKLAFESTLFSQVERRSLCCSLATQGGVANHRIVNLQNAQDLYQALDTNLQIQNAWEALGDDTDTIPWASFGLVDRLIAGNFLVPIQNA